MQKGGLPLAPGGGHIHTAFGWCQAIRSLRNSCRSTFTVLLVRPWVQLNPPARGTPFRTVFPGRCGGWHDPHRPFSGNFFGLSACFNPSADGILPLSPSSDRGSSGTPPTRATPPHAPLFPEGKGMIPFSPRTVCRNEPPQSPSGQPVFRVELMTTGLFFPDCRNRGRGFVRHYPQPLGN